MGFVRHDPFGNFRSIAFRNALVAHVGFRRCSRLPQGSCCWNRPRLVWSSFRFTFSSVDSTIVVVTAIAAARCGSPRAFTAATTFRAQQIRSAFRLPRRLPRSCRLSRAASAPSAGRRFPHG
jgi:hypothetical protein